MIIYLRHATDSQTRKLPVFVDSTDGDSEETGLTIANTDILIGKPGGTTLTAKHSGGATHISNGIYYATFDSSDSDTVGNGELYIHKAGALYVFATLVILPAKVYDSLFLGSDNLEVDIVQLLGTAWLTPAVAGTPDVNAKTVADKTGFSLSVTPPTASAIADAVLDEAASGHTGVIATNLDAAVSTRSTYAGGAVASVTEGVTVTTNNDKTGYSLSVTPPTASQIDTQLSGTHGSGAWGASTTGSSTYTDTITDDDGDPLEDVQVELYSSSDYSGTPVAVEETDVNGVFTFSLNPGTYYVRCLKSGYTFTDFSKVVS